MAIAAGTAIAAITMAGTGVAATITACTGIIAIEACGGHGHHCPCLGKTKWPRSGKGAAINFHGTSSIETHLDGDADQVRMILGA
jgi:hypothetical protein